MNIRHYELVAEAQSFLSKNYSGMTLTIPIEFNTRTKNRFGGFFHERIGSKIRPVKIDVSVDFIRTHPREHILDVFRHELVHYACVVLEKPHRDGEDFFENELKRLGVSSTRVYKALGDFHRYECKNCSKAYEKKRKISEHAYCNCSKAPNLTYIGIVHKSYEAVYGK
jgi:SprT-like protein